MTLVKAVIKSKDARVECAFNPTEYSISKGAEWRQTPTSGASTAPTPEFVGTNPRTLVLKLLFDAWATGEPSVASAVDQLLTWTNPTASSISKGTPNPPILAFTWGQNSFFDAYLQSVSAQYTMFKPDGTPLRATVDVTLVEVPNEPAGQNPTSGSLAGYWTTIVADGDSLHSIAYREYGNPTLWRGLAAANAIDDPLAIGPGTSLLIPPRELAAELS
jgi:contractile injection system tube protein